MQFSQCMVHNFQPIKLLQHVFPGEPDVMALAPEILMHDVARSCMVLVAWKAGLLPFSLHQSTCMN